MGILDRYFLIIGMTLAAYTMARLIQVPLAIQGRTGDGVPQIPPAVRFWISTGVSALAALVIGVLALWLLVTAAAARDHVGPFR